jgi:hypothetical protein
MIFVLANQDLIMPDRAPISSAPKVDRPQTPTAALSPSQLAAVVEARYILDLRRR